MHLVAARQGGREVRQLPAIAPDLLGGMQYGLGAVLRYVDEVVVDRLRIRPLLELDEDVGRPVRPRMHTAEQSIDSFRGVGEPVFEQDLYVVQSRVPEVLEEGGQAEPPRVDLTHTGPQVEPHPGLLAEQLVQLAGFGLLEQYVGAVTDQSHEKSPTGHASSACGWGQRRVVDSVPVGPRRAL